MSAPSTFLVLVLSLWAHPAWSTTPAEEAYWKARNTFIEKLKGASRAADRAALAQLEVRLRKIIGPADVEGFPQQGEINLETLDSDAEVGFGQADGLRFRNNRETLFITTPGLLNLYSAGDLKTAKEMPAPKLASLASDMRFLSALFASDAAATYYVEVPVDSRNGESATAFLGNFEQDTGPFVPEHLFVFATKGRRILIAQIWKMDELPQISHCAKEWDNEKNDYAYRECYGREAKTEPFFAALKQQAQSLVDRLQKDPPRRKQ